MDLFSTLMVSLKLDSHRVRFTRYDQAMEKVVVVVVVTMRDGSFGSGMRLDWENLSEPRSLEQLG
jgi:hypothetical protein